MNNARLLAQLREGFMVFGGLGIFSVIEYFVSIMMNAGSAPILMGIALIKTWLILHFFMHMRHLWDQEDHGHD